MSTQATAVQSVTSKDGVEIAYWKSGAGPNLVLVHGTSADHTRWRSVLPMFEKHFTVNAMDRRGRGRSGDATEYALDLEFDDVAAVCNALEGPVSLLGHSYGALCALEAALRSTTVEKLVLYEAPFATEDYAPMPDTQRRYEDMLAQGDRDGMLVAFFREIVGMSESEVAMMRADPSWQGRLAAAHTVPREFADATYVLDPSRFESLRTPTLLLAGSESPAFLRTTTEQLNATLPNSRVVVMEGQAHVAITTAPQLFAERVLEFLRE